MVVAFNPAPARAISMSRLPCRCRVALRFEIGVAVAAFTAQHHDRRAYWCLEPDGVPEVLDRELRTNQPPGSSDDPRRRRLRPFQGASTTTRTGTPSRGGPRLVETVAHWRKTVRAGEIGRDQGDEFALLLDRIDSERAQQIMTRLRQSSPFPWSWGASQARPGDTNELIFGRADARLYTFKSRPGRGRS